MGNKLRRMSQNTLEDVKLPMPVENRRCSGFFTRTDNKCKTLFSDAARIVKPECCTYSQEQALQQNHWDNVAKYSLNWTFYSMLQILAASGHTYIWPHTFDSCCRSVLRMSSSQCEYKIAGVPTASVSENLLTSHGSFTEKLLSTENIRTIVFVRTSFFEK